MGTTPLALVLGADTTILPLTKEYLSKILWFSPFFIINNIVLAFVRNDNNPNLIMIAMLMGSFSYICDIFGLTECIVTVMTFYMVKLKRNLQYK